MCLDLCRGGAEALGSTVIDGWTIYVEGYGPGAE
jgi:hypothetical protein